MNQSPSLAFYLMFLAKKWSKFQSFDDSFQLFSVDDSHDKYGSGFDSINNPIISRPQPVKRRLESLEFSDLSSRREGSRR
jgi:hypothetical protein